MKENFERVYVTQDESGHWYTIPYNLKEEFELYYYIEDFNMFDEKYGKYRTNGDINNVQLFIKNTQLNTNNC